MRREANVAELSRSSTAKHARPMHYDSIVEGRATQTRETRGEIFVSRTDTRDYNDTYGSAASRNRMSTAGEIGQIRKAANRYVYYIESLLLRRRKEFRTLLAATPDTFGRKCNGRIRTSLALAS